MTGGEWRARSRSPPPSPAALRQLASSLNLAWASYPSVRSAPIEDVEGILCLASARTHSDPQIVAAEYGAILLDSFLDGGDARIEAGWGTLDAITN